MLEKYHDVITVGGMCKILRIGRNSAYRLLQEGVIQSRRLRRKYLIPKTVLIEYLLSQ